ncbi:hypothetical protein FF2_023108 [Malus domestica]
MANFNCNMVYLFYLMMIFFWFGHFSASAFEFQVGGNKDWVVPSANDTKIYNDWASENRFQVGDTIRFHYKKDSVMEVMEAEYKKCNSTRPNFFSNTGNTVYTLDHSGSFYFISGAAGHCERGQRMIVKVMAAEEEDFPSGGDAKRSSDAAVSSVGVFKHVLVPFVMSYAVASVMF